MTIKTSNILVIEKDQDNIRLFKSIFKNEAVNLVFVNSINQAYYQLRLKNTKVIIADYIYSGDNLINFFNEIQHTLPYVQKVILTDHFDSLTISKAINKGCIFHYLYKPIDPGNIIVVVNKAISQHNLLKQNSNLVNRLQAKNRELKSTLQKLKYQDEKFKTIFKSSSDPSFIIDLDGLILESNPYGDEILKRTNLSIGNSNILEIITETHRKKLVQKLKNIKSNQQHSITEIQLSHHQSFQYYELKVYPILFKNRISVIASLRDITSRKLLQKKEMQTIILTEEKERTRFAQDLHDGIGPILSTALLYLQWFNKPNANLDKATIVSKIEETIEEAYNSIQEISNNISPNTLTLFGLDIAIKKFIQRIKGLSNICFNYYNQINYKISNQLEITIYRILCELINNTIKHANAKNIDIKITDDNTFNIYYYDDGIGFNINKIHKKGNGFGLSNIKARVESLGGNYKIFSSQNKGISVNIKLLKD